MATVRILVIDDDEASQRALRSVLDSEGWHIEAVARPELGLTRLAAGGWNLVIANVTVDSLSSPLFNLLKELAEAKGSLRVLFLVPAITEAHAQQVLEEWKLPYATKPLRLHDFLEQVSDLLLEAGTIREPLQRVRGAGPVAPERRLQDRSKQKQALHVMFADRDPYFEYTEEELRQFEEEEKQRKKQPTPGEPHSG